MGFRRLGLLLLCLAFTSGCGEWVSPLETTSANLALGVVTVSLKENAGTAPWVGSERAAYTVQAASDHWQRACGIRLVHVKHYEKDAAAEGVAYRANDDELMNELRDRFAHRNYISVVFAAELRHDRDEASFIGGSANYPWSDRWVGRQAILMSGAYRSVFAHELGHFFGLEHEKNDYLNLMYPGDYGDSIKRPISLDQCAIAREYILGHQALREICRPLSPDPELSGDYCPEPSL